jgi:DNA (cytosine-5)-methyltransferase 1
MDDPRNGLFKWFVRIAAMTQPKVVLIENVPDLVRHREGRTLAEILDALAEAGYLATVRVLNAANFGVPQLRRRMSLLAQRVSDLAETGSAGLSRADIVPTRWATDLVRTGVPSDAAIDDGAGSATAWPVACGDEHRGHTATMTTLRRFLRSPEGLPLANHIARPLGASGLAKLRRREVETPAEADRSGRRDHYYYSYKRLRWAEPARTITKFAYHIGSGMFAHPEADRALTMREAARLQTFPDWFAFPTERIRETSGLIGGPSHRCWQ